nr:MAG TPA: Baseplate wedge protein [Caudoviricetes sp.]
MAKPENWGVTNVGFYCPTYSEIITEKIKTAQMLFGDDIDTGEQSVLGKFIRIDAKDDKRLYQLAELLYYSRFPNTATGISLDRICALAGITRKSASYARHVLRICGTNGHIISAGTRFKSDNGIVFWCQQTKTIDKIDVINDETIYYADVTVESETSGVSGNVTSINSLVEVDPDITAVEYLEVELVGEDEESDVELRERFTKVVQGLGTNSRTSIIAALLKLSYVSDAIIIDNNSSTDKVISDGLTVSGRSYGVIVHTSDDEHTAEIAQTIFDKQPLGIIQSGTTTANITDESDTEHTIKFSYARDKSVNISVTCKVSAAFNSDAELRAALQNAVSDLKIGEDVIFSTFYRHIYNIADVVEVTELKLNNGTSNISVAQDEVAKLGTITITYAEGN